MIVRGANKKISEVPTLPFVADAVKAFLQPVKIGIMQKQQIDGYTQEIPIWKSTIASRQPMSQAMSVKKEGNRSWRWHVIHITNDVDLETDSIIVLSNVRYRVMEKMNWSEYGYFEYHVIEDYKPTDL